MNSKPQTELGKRLRELRRQIVASGHRLLDWDELEREVEERRGELSTDTWMAEVRAWAASFPQRDAPVDDSRERCYEEP